MTIDPFTIIKLIALAVAFLALRTAFRAAR